MKNINILIGLAIMFSSSLTLAGIRNPTAKVCKETSKTIDVPGTYNGTSTTTSPDGTHTTTSINCINNLNTVCFTTTVPCAAAGGNTDVENGDLEAINTYPRYVILSLAGGSIIDQGTAVFYSNSFLNGNILNRLHTFVLEY